MPNRLESESSAYLLQHKDNPIDWWPWCDEAWKLAQEFDRPVFLSIGYSSCHWCHVMAHESFENIEVAEALNRDFVCIKLDREERPDIDEAYMTAVQMSNGHGGWPMSLFLTPDKQPFFAGTYFPRDTRGEFPGFLTIVGSLSKAWRDQKGEVKKAAADFTAALTAAMERTLPTDFDRLTVSIIDQAVEEMHQHFDDEHGGFGGRPKFPPHAALRFLLDYATMRPDLGGDYGDLAERAGHMAVYTLEQMALGGIYDHVGGGFHRYSTDDHWLLPHFEKMIYDNAQLVSSYAVAARVVTDDRVRSLFERVVDKTLQWVKDEMTRSDGLFSSSLDADSEGGEGTYYVWAAHELPENPGFREAYGVLEGGNFRDEATGEVTGENILHLLEDDLGAFETELELLGSKRRTRTMPSLDDKALAAWNGLMVSAFVLAGRCKEAVVAADFWAKAVGEGLHHMVARESQTGTAFLDDLAYLADAFLDMHEATGESKWRDAAMAACENVLRHHSDTQGGFLYTSQSHENLFGRTKPFLDNATPSPNGIMARVLRRLGRRTEAMQTVHAGLGSVQRMPRGTETLLREITWLLWESNDGSELLLPQRTLTGIEVKATIEPREVQIEDDGWGYTELVLTVPHGSHINSHEPLAQWLVPTTVSLEGVYGEASFPESKDGVFKGETRVPIRVKPKGGSIQFEVRARFQACTESECFMPQEVTLTGSLVAL